MKRNLILSPKLSGMVSNTKIFNVLSFSLNSFLQYNHRFSILSLVKAFLSPDPDSTAKVRIQKKSKYKQSETNCLFFEIQSCLGSCEV